MTVIFVHALVNSLSSGKIISGFVLSNIGNFDLLKDYKSKYEFIGNYNLNVFNNETISNLHVNTMTLSPELNKD